MHVPSWGALVASIMWARWRKPSRNRYVYFCLRTCKIYQSEGSQIIGDDRARVKLKLGQDRMHALSLKRERRKQTQYLRAAKSLIVGRMGSLTSCGCNLATIDICQINMRNYTSHKRYDHGHDSIVSRGRAWHTVSARWRAKKQSLNYLKGKNAV